MSDAVVRIDMQSERDMIRALEDRCRDLAARLAEAEGRVASPFFSRAEAAEYLRVSVESVDRELAAGRLPRRVFRGRVLIPRAALPQP